VETSHIAAFLLKLSHPSDSTPGGHVCLHSRHSRGYVLLDELIKVETKFCFEFCIDLAAA
jgi:hypothetical protein